MDTVLDHTWTVESFLAWEDRREFKYEFDGRGPVPTTGGSLAHQRIVVNLCFALMTLLERSLYQVAQEMRLRIDRRVRYSGCGDLRGSPRSDSAYIDRRRRAVRKRPAIPALFRAPEVPTIPSLRSALRPELRTVTGGSIEIVAGRERRRR